MRQRGMDTAALRWGSIGAKRLRGQAGEGSSACRLDTTTIIGSYPKPNWYTQGLHGRSFKEVLGDFLFREQYLDAVAAPWASPRRLSVVLRRASPLVTCRTRPTCEATGRRRG